ncbi:hypothetical protein K0M31_020272 [Melipona bicolor]|uniref:Uncharacterized protein n=1 Tax=Melipona bicolor TaxID=60889 RepID=A0AA40G1R9_9HYME|nr:hypothetical protein K0M31_020272 [Melipona bicolor]
MTVSQVTSEFKKINSPSFDYPSDLANDPTTSSKNPRLAHIQTAISPKVNSHDSPEPTRKATPISPGSWALLLIPGATNTTFTNGLEPVHNF